MYIYFTTMKSVQQKLRWPGMIAGLALLALAFSSCTKHTDNAPQAPTSDLAVIDVSPSAPNVDFYLDGSKVNASPITYGGGLEYFICYAGNRHAVFYQSGSITAIASDTVNLQASGAYTMILSNLPSSPDITLLRDSIFAPPSGSATIRLVNASPDAGAIDFGLKGQPVLASNVTYRKYTAFLPVQLNGSLNDTLQIYKGGTSTILQKIPLSLQVGGVYTAYLYGFLAQTSTSQKLNAGLMENTFFY